MPGLAKRMLSRNTPDPSPKEVFHFPMTAYFAEFADRRHTKRGENCAFWYPAPLNAGIRNGSVRLKDDFVNRIGRLFDCPSPGCGGWVPRCRLRRLQRR
jgi:hypothetical protein